MTYVANYAAQEPSRPFVDGLPGVTVLEFGASWCGVCRSAQSAIRAALAMHPEAEHLKIEDGPGRPLGRSFGVKLWPTVIVLKDGQEVGRVVRPRSREALLPVLAGTPTQD